MDDFFSSRKSTDIHSIAPYDRLAYSQNITSVRKNKCTLFDNTELQNCSSEMET